MGCSSSKHKVSPQQQPQPQPPAIEQQIATPQLQPAAPVLTQVSPAVAEPLSIPVPDTVQPAGVENVALVATPTQEDHPAVELNSVEVPVRSAPIMEEATAVQSVPASQLKRAQVVPGAAADAANTVAAEGQIRLPKGDWVKTEGTEYYYSATENLYYHPPSRQFYDPSNGMWYDPGLDEWYHDDVSDDEDAGAAAVAAQG